jgi:hypothetical protein
MGQLDEFSTPGASFQADSPKEIPHMKTKNRLAFGRAGSKSSDDGDGE